MRSILRRSKASIVFGGCIVFTLIMSLASMSAFAATLHWTPPSLYTDKTPISAADKASAVYTPAIGSSSSGPWVDQANTPPGATSAVVPAPPEGQIRWYSVKCTINGQTSAYATPGVSLYVPFPVLVPGAPSGLTVVP